MSAASSSSSSSSRPSSASQPSGDDLFEREVAALLAGRRKKEFFSLPSLSSTANTRPAKLLLSSEDFLHLLGEVDGSLYGSCGRPELDVLVVNSSANKEHLSLTDVPIDNNGNNNGNNNGSNKKDDNTDGNINSSVKNSSNINDNINNNSDTQQSSVDKLIVDNAEGDKVSDNSRGESQARTQSETETKTETHRESVADSETLAETATENTIAQSLSGDDHHAISTADSGNNPERLPTPKQRDFDAGAVLLLYDAARCAFILTEDIELALMKLITHSLPLFQHWGKEVVETFTRTQALSAIDEEDANSFRDELSLPGLKKHAKSNGEKDESIEIVIVRSYCMFSNTKQNTMEPLREKLWRRFLSREIFPLFNDFSQVNQLRILLFEEWKAQSLLNLSQDSLLTDESGDPSDPKKRLKGKKSKPKKTKTASHAKTKGKKIKTRDEEDTHTEEDTDENEEMTTDDEATVDKDDHSSQLSKDKEKKVKEKSKEKEKDKEKEKGHHKNKEKHKTSHDEDAALVGDDHSGKVAKPPKKDKLSHSDHHQPRENSSKK